MSSHGSGKTFTNCAWPDAPFEAPASLGRDVRPFIDLSKRELDLRKRQGNAPLTHRVGVAPGAGVVPKMPLHAPAVLVYDDVSLEGRNAFVQQRFLPTISDLRAQ